MTERRSEEPLSRLKCSSPELHHLSTVAATASERGSQLTATSSTLGPSTLLSVDKRHSRLGESSPNLSRIHHTHTQLSLGLPNKMNQTNDFFSSTEYCQYVCSREDIDSFNGNSTGGKSSEQPIQAAFLRKSRKDGGGLHLDDVSTSHHHNNHQQKGSRNLKYSQSSRRKYEQATTTTSGSSTDDSDRGSGSSSGSHHRSHSAGPHTTYSTTSNHAVSTTEMNRSGVRGGPNAESNTTFLRATKRFFKKIYTSATLPKKQNSTSMDNFQKSSVFFEDTAHHHNPNMDGRILKKAPLSTDENDYSNHLDDDYDDETMRSENATMDISYPDSGFEMDRASTPEQSSVSMTSTSKSGDDPVNFTNLFEQLKREMKEMRERDAQILSDLQRVETQIQSVKQAQILASLQDEFEPVESMPL